MERHVLGGAAGSHRAGIFESGLVRFGEGAGGDFVDYRGGQLGVAEGEGGVFHLRLSRAVLLRSDEGPGDRGGEDEADKVAGEDEGGEELDSEYE